MMNNPILWPCTKYRQFGRRDKSMEFDFVIYLAAESGDIYNNNYIDKRDETMHLTLPHLVMITAALLIAHSLIWA